MNVGDLEKTTKGRYFLNTHVVPYVATLLKNGQRVLFVGTDTSWDYKPFFWNPAKQCPYETMDKAAHLNPDIIGDIQSCPQIPDSTYGLVILIGVYEFLEKKPEAFAEIMRILEPGGYLLAALPGKGYYNDNRGVTLIEAAEVVKDFKFRSVYCLYQGNNQAPSSIILLVTKGGD